jgi:hypothetical protein
MHRGTAHREGGRGGALKPIEEPTTPVSSNAQAWTLGCSESVWSSEGGRSARERRKVTGRLTAPFSQAGEGREGVGVGGRRMGPTQEAQCHFLIYSKMFKRFELIQLKEILPVLQKFQIKY